MHATKAMKSLNKILFFKWKSENQVYFFHLYVHMWNFHVVNFTNYFRIKKTPKRKIGVSEIFFDMVDYYFLVSLIFDVITYYPLFSFILILKTVFKA